MKALVIGGAGFIGSHVVEHLCGSSVEVTVIDNLSRGSMANMRHADCNFINADVRDTEVVDEAVRAVDGGPVFMLAAKWLLDCITRPETAWSVNFQSAKKVADICARHGAPLVFSSSASVYGDAVTDVMTEDHPLNGWSTTYGATKIAAEAAVMSSGAAAVALRYANVYGPRQDMLGAYTGVIAKWIAAAERGEPLVLSNQDAVYDFVHVRDVARANVAAAWWLMDRHGRHQACLNVSTNIGTSLGDLAGMMRGIYDDATIHITPASRPAVTRRVMSHAALTDATGWEPHIGIRDGLHHMADWFKSCAE